MRKKTKLTKGGKTFLEKLTGKVYEGPYISDNIYNSFINKKQNILLDEYKTRKELAEKDLELITAKKNNADNLLELQRDRNFKYDKLNSNNFFHRVNTYGSIFKAICAFFAYLIDKLKTNGFNIRYIHPNTLFIAWNHFVPSYVRTEIKKKTGLIIDQNGNKVDESNNGETKLITAEPSNPNEYMFNQSGKVDPNGASGKPKKEYTPIKSYKPSGNLIYDDDLLNKIEDRFH